MNIPFQQGKKMLTKSLKTRQQGIGLPMVLGILVILGLAGWLMSQGGGAGSSNIADATARGAATAVIGQANALDSAFQQAALNGVSPLQAALDADPDTGIYHPNVGGLTPLAPLTRALTDPLTAWGLMQVSITGFGTGAAEQLVVLSNVRPEVCVAIAQAFRGNTVSSVPSYAGWGDVEAEFAPVVAGMPTNCVNLGGVHTAYRVVASY